MGVDLRKNKDLLLNAAWHAGVEFVSTTGYGLSGEDEEPDIILGVYTLGQREDAINNFKAFVRDNSSICFSVSTAPSTAVMKSQLLLISGKEWVLPDE